MLTQEKLKKWLHYDPATGIFLWLKQPAYSVKIGSVAGSDWQNFKRSKSRYWKISVERKQYLAHRLAWLYMHGVWPNNQVDHIDGDGLNNKFSNLREATAAQNQMNSKKPKSNTGFRGVHIARKKFRSFIRINGKPTALGTFVTVEEAYAAYVAAAREHHGEFARIE